LADKFGICPNCGATYHFPIGSFPLITISDSAYDQLSALFLKQVDYYPCRVCSEPLDTRPTVVIRINEGLEYLYCLSDHFIDVPDSIRTKFVEAMQLKGARAEAFTTLDELRVAYAMRIVSMAEQFHQALHTLARDFDEFSTGDWRALTSNVFAAANIALSIDLPRVSVSFSLPSEEALERMAVLQAGVWLCLCNSWSFEPEKGRTLEGDLESYMALNAMEPDVILRAAEEFLRWTEPPEILPLVTKFSLEAMRASLCSWCEKPNPRLREWADLFVEQEVERRLSDAQAASSSSLFVAMEISAERARTTIPYEELFDACLRQLQMRGLEVLPQLEIGRESCRERV